MSSGVRVPAKETARGVRGGDRCEGGSIGQIGFTLIEDIQAATVALRTHGSPSMTSRGCFKE
ncbi:hypothetical protein GCM10011574_68020 [Microbispora bryophytorum]|uniref:Uncharacterized protein n=1 Tax=Microbispora bryophytorum TaxID=1460882 RepID=A0A8H9H667_9ACTN|nr:hypothetical protein GCM10011574_68020 [Microbispora bryophytorum]